MAATPEQLLQTLGLDTASEMVVSVIQRLASGAGEGDIPKELIDLTKHVMGQAGMQARVQATQQGRLDTIALNSEARKEIINAQSTAQIARDQAKVSGQVRLKEADRLQKSAALQDKLRLIRENKEAERLASLHIDPRSRAAMPDVRSTLRLLESNVLNNRKGETPLIPEDIYATHKKVVEAVRDLSGEPRFKGDLERIDALREVNKAGAAKESLLKLEAAYADAMKASNLPITEVPASLRLQVEAMAKGTGLAPSNDILKLAADHVAQQQRAFSFDSEAERVLKTHGKTAAGLGKNAAQSLPEVLAAAKNDAVSGKLDVKSAISRVESAMTESAAASGKSKLGWGAAIAALMLPFLLRKKKDDQPSPQEQMALMQALESARQSSDLNTALVNSKNAIASRDQAKADLLRMQAMQLMPQAGMSGGGL